MSACVLQLPACSSDAADVAALVDSRWSSHKLMILGRREVCNADRNVCHIAGHCTYRVLSHLQLVARLEVHDCTTHTTSRVRATSPGIDTTLDFGVVFVDRHRKTRTINCGAQPA